MERIKHILLLAALLLGSIATTAQNEEPIDIANNADAMLYTNAKCTNTSYGDQFAGWHVLFDNDASTFFHSEYSNKNSEDGLDHYLRVDLGEGSKVNAFSFTYTVRGSIPYNGNYSPKTMIVEGSNTAYGTYTELVSLNNLPNTGAAVYKSPVIRNGTAYRYIRFRVTETYTNSKVQGHSYFFMAEFGMMRVRIEGTCGDCWDNLSWKLTDDNELIIKGTGDMYDYSSESAPWNKYRESIQTITIGEGVTSISPSAFNNCSNLTSITIPESVTSIGEHAFYKCSSLTSITLPEGVTNIENSAFGYCSSLTAITIPESVTSIGSGAFYYCSSLTAITIPEGVTSIGKSAFYGTSWYNNQPDGVVYVNNVLYKYKGTMPANTSIDVREGTVSISPYAFDDCTSLTSITIPGGVTSIEDATFYGCSSLTAITIPEGVTSIGNSAFSGCSSLTSITIPESVTSIGPYAFYKCSSLTSITLPENSQLTSFGNYAFRDCSSLKTVINYSDLYIQKGSSSNGYVAYYADRVINLDEFIGDYAFKTKDGVHSLTGYIGDDTELTLPTDYQGENYQIGSSAFYNCSSLTSITIPENSQLTSIGYRAFDGCSSLTAVNISSIEAWCYIDFEDFYANPLYYAKNLYINGELVTELVIPNSVTAVKDYAFRSCTSLTIITIPEGVTSIGGHAFYNCSSLTSITIPENSKLTSIGSYAFYECSSLASITLPESVTSIGSGAFYYCSSLTSITIPENSKLTSIGSYAFYECSSLASITLPEGVTSIEDEAFRGCSSLTTITIPENSKLTSIGDYAFYGCSSLTAITIPEGVTSIGDWAFYNCSSLTTVHISSIEAWCYIDFENSSANPLYYAKNLYINGELVTELAIPNSVTAVKDYAFAWCSSLTSITIPEGVTSIGDDAFYNCSSLTAITIPEGVTSIGDWAFYNCSKLAELTSLATTPPALGSNTTFGNVNKSIPVYVPAASVEAYKSAEHWSEFTNYQTIKEPAPEAVTITISKYGSGTYSSAYALDFSEVQGLKAYVATGYNHLTGVVTLLRVHTADAATGLLVKGTPGASYEVPVMEYTADRTLNMLVPTLERTEVDSHSSDGVYANYKYTVDPAQNPDEPLFYPFADDSHLSAGKAYLQIPVAWLPAKEEKARSIRLRFDEGETTDMEETTDDGGQSMVIYDLYGRRVVSPKKGEIYIVNNQKVIY